MDSIEVERLLADEVRLKHWECTLMFDVAGQEGEHDILQYVKPNALAKDLQLMMECTRNGFPKQCMMRFLEVYSGEMMWDMLKSSICKASEEQGYTLRTIQCDKSTVSTKSATSGIPVIGWTYSLGCVRSRLYQSRQTMRSFVKDGDNLVFELGNKATLMKVNRNIEQRGPLGKTLPRKTTTNLPVVAQQRCPFRINIYYHKSDGYYYMSTNGNVHNFQKGIICSHHYHERQTVVFSSRTDMDEHVEKMVKQFAMTNSSPSDCVRMLDRMDDRLYDVQTFANIFNKAKKSLLEEKGVDTSSTKAQQLVDFLMTNPDTNAVIVIHDPSSALIGGRQKGRPSKKRENHLVLLMKMANKEASVEELVFDKEYTVDAYAQARRHALYLPDSDAMLLYVAWCTNEELRMATIFGSFWTLDTTPMTNIEDRPLMIMAGMCTNRKSCPYGRAFLPSEGEWVFDFSMVVALPLLYGNTVI
jgi:hypothetical protein